MSDDNKPSGAPPRFVVELSAEEPTIIGAAPPPAARPAKTIIGMASPNLIQRQGPRPQRPTPVGPPPAPTVIVREPGSAPVPMPAQQPMPAQPGTMAKGTPPPAPAIVSAPASPPAAGTSPQVSANT